MTLPFIINRSNLTLLQCTINSTAPGISHIDFPVTTSLSPTISTTTTFNQISLTISQSLSPTATNVNLTIDNDTLIQKKNFDMLNEPILMDFRILPHGFLSSQNPSQTNNISDEFPKINARVK